LGGIFAGLSGNFPGFPHQGMPKKIGGAEFICEMLYGCAATPHFTAPICNPKDPRKIQQNRLGLP
jgi:hypothetical protein